MTTSASSWPPAALLLAALFGCPVPAGDNQLTEAEKKEGWILLFDGKTLDGWMTSGGKPSRTPVEDGCINPHGCGDYMVVYRKPFANFVLALDFQITPKCNSGIFVRTHSLAPLPGKDVGYNGIEIAIDHTETSGYTDTGALYDLSRPKKNAMKGPGEWNHVLITCDRSRIKVELNGELVNDVDLSRFTERGKRPDGTPHKFDTAYKDHPLEGYIGLQDHGFRCLYKNIKLKPLP
jgi:hypothetical protein